MGLNKNELKEDFDRFSKEWKNTSEYNQFIYDYFEQKVYDNEILNNHNEIIAKYGLGYGERAFRYLWALVFSQTPNNSKFLEIGVYKGSILSLSQLLANEFKINLSTYGVTPLNNTGDKYSIYDNVDYENSITFLYHLLNLKIDETYIIQGLSTDPLVKNAIEELGEYDVVYIDGGHDYETVVNDIHICTKVLKKNGLMIMDDASSFLNFSKTHKGFTGHNDVGKAIIDLIDNKNEYTHLFACGHNRVWKKN